MTHLIEKRDGSIKGRMVCNGAPTTEWLGQEESASLTAAQESAMSLAVVDVHEHQDAMMSDVPNAFIQTVLECHDGDDRVMMKITGVLVDILLADDPDLCGGHIVCENGKKVPCVAIS